MEQLTQLLELTKKNAKRSSGETVLYWLFAQLDEGNESDAFSDIRTEEWSHFHAGLQSIFAELFPGQSFSQIVMNSLLGKASLDWYETELTRSRIKS